MEIRVLTANDTSAYWTIRLEALECDSEAFGSSPEEHRALTHDELAARISYDPANKFVVGVFSQKRLVGTAGFFRDKELKARHKGHIWGVYVTRDARGQGVGRKMLQAVLERATRIDGLEQILLSVGATRDAASRLYQSLGFESYGCERRALKIGDRYVDEENMILFLSRTRSQ